MKACHEAGAGEDIGADVNAGAGWLLRADTSTAANNSGTTVIWAYRLTKEVDKATKRNMSPVVAVVVAGKGWAALVVVANAEGSLLQTMIDCIDSRENG